MAPPSKRSIVTDEAAICHRSRMAPGSGASPPAPSPAGAAQLVGQDRARHGHVEGIEAALRDGDPFAHRSHCATGPLRSPPSTSTTTRRRPLRPSRMSRPPLESAISTRGTGCPLAARAARRAWQVGRLHLGHQRQGELRAHTTAQGLGAVRVGGARRADDSAQAEGHRAPDEGAHVARVAHAVEEEDQFAR